MITALQAARRLRILAALAGFAFSLPLAFGSPMPAHGGIVDVTIVTTVHDTGHITVTQVDLGMEVHARAVVTHPRGIVTGNVEARFFSDGNCGAIVALSPPVALSGGIAESLLPRVETAPAIRSYQVTYKGNVDHGPKVGACTTIAWVKHPATLSVAVHTAAHQVVTTAFVGQAIHVAGTVTGSAGTPTGSVSVIYFLGPSCAHPVAAASWPLGNGAFDTGSAPYTPTSPEPISIRARYLGDSVYAADAPPCFMVDVVAATPAPSGPAPTVGPTSTPSSTGPGTTLPPSSSPGPSSTAQGSSAAPSAPAGSAPPGSSGSPIASGPPVTSGSPAASGSSAAPTASHDPSGSFVLTAPPGSSGAGASTEPPGAGSSPLPEPAGGTSGSSGIAIVLVAIAGALVLGAALLARLRMRRSGPAQ